MPQTKMTGWRIRQLRCKKTNAPRGLWVGRVYSDGHELSWFIRRTTTDYYRYRDPQDKNLN